MISSVTFWIEAATSMYRSVSGVSGSRGGPPKRRWNAGDVMVSPSAKLK